MYDFIKYGVWSNSGTVFFCQMLNYFRKNFNFVLENRAFHRQWHMQNVCGYSQEAFL